MLAVCVTNQQKSVKIDKARIGKAVRMILHEAGVVNARLSVAAVDNPTIQNLHRQFLGHDAPTDVLSFELERSEGYLEGEVVVSGETARAVASRYRSTPEEEFLRYVIHGVLHLVGFQDRTQAQRAAMRRQEHKYLCRLRNTPTTRSRTRRLG